MKAVTWRERAIFGVVLLAAGCNHSHTAKQSGSLGPDVNDLTFAQDVYKEMANDDRSVADELDWPHLRIGSTNVGAVYNRYPGEEYQSAFKTSYIDNFSKAYLTAGGNPNSLKNWRLERSTNDGCTVVASAANGNKFLFNISKTNGNRLLVSITFARE